MQCPTGDGQLVAHSIQGENKTTLTYSICDTCRGFWMEPFAANFITLPPEEMPGTSGNTQLYPSGTEWKCPVCTKSLIRSTGENIPDGVSVFACPDGHGYFFPNGQFALFKKAQQSKITYHKLWHVPLHSVASVLLVGFVVLVLTGGLIAGYLAIQNRQTTTSQATSLLTAQSAYINTNVRSVLISAKTGYDATLTLHIPGFNNFQKQLDTKDHRLHTVTVQNVPPDTYDYYFTILINGEEVQSDTYTFVMSE